MNLKLLFFRLRRVNMILQKNKIDIDSKACNLIFERNKSKVCRIGIARSDENDDEKRKLKLYSYFLFLHFSFAFIYSLRLIMFFIKTKI